MDYFEYKDGRLFCEDADITDIAGAVGTPFYLYSKRTLLRHCDIIHRALGEVEHLTCYSVKANSNLAVLALLAAQGIGADVVSGGELFRALKAGFAPEKIVYSGVGKTEAEIEYGLGQNILTFNVESIPELELINDIAGTMGKLAPVALRVNPDIDPKTHPYIATGLRENKFGIPHAQALEGFRLAAGMRNLRVIGVDAHIGSQITELDPFVESAKKLCELVETLKDDGISIEQIDIGGGLGIRYADEIPPEPSEWAGAIVPVLKGMGCRIIFEPGRSLVGNAGILVTKVLYIKRSGDKVFVVVDAGMNDLIRPALYGSQHEIRPVIRIDSEETVVDIVGPVCESADFFAKDRTIPLPGPGDLLAIMGAGAYGFTMSSNYNSRPRCPEVLVEGSTFKVVRERENYEDLIRGEHILVD
ncbi:MAG TPA: diaminopimelate decarboxylase [Candidatus Latescibacteria bacterium]|nr:diaminopimelate decarboxylase [Candidatus Latescibacterota bacterium]